VHAVVEERDPPDGFRTARQASARVPTSTKTAPGHHRRRNHSRVYRLGGYFWVQEEGIRPPASENRNRFPKPRPSRTATASAAEAAAMERLQATRRLVVVHAWTQPPAITDP